MKKKGKNKLKVMKNSTCGVFSPKDNHILNILKCNICSKSKYIECICITVIVLQCYLHNFVNSTLKAFY